MQRAFMLLAALAVVGTPVAFGATEPSCISMYIYSLNECSLYCSVVHDDAASSFTGGICVCGDTTVCGSQYTAPTCASLDVSTADDCSSQCADYANRPPYPQVQAMFEAGVSCNCSNFAVCTFQEPPTVSCSDIGLYSIDNCEASCASDSALSGVLDVEATDNALDSCVCSVTGIASPFVLCGQFDPDAYYSDAADAESDGLFDLDMLDFSDPQLLDLARDNLIEEAGEQCRKPITNAISKNVLKCLFEEVANDNSTLSLLLEPSSSTTPSDLVGGICGNKCIPTIFSAMTKLIDAKCLGSGFTTPALTTSSSEEDFVTQSPTFTSSASMVDLGGIVGGEGLINLVCTVSSTNERFCGEILDTVGAAIASTPTKAQCETIAGYGKCLGSILYVAENDADILSTFGGAVNRTAIAADLADKCSAQGVDTIAEAAAGTEEPSNLASSGATMAAVMPTGLAALVVVAAAFLA